MGVQLQGVFQVFLGSSSVPKFIVNHAGMVVESGILDAGLRDLRRGHRAALDSGDPTTARSIRIQIGELLDGWVSA
jgi:hypothetical protein